MKTHSVSDPVIVMGMMRSGTTLLAEMVHKGGTPMFPIMENVDPSYDGGIKYERPLAHELNLLILGQPQKGEAIDLAGRALHPLPPADLERLLAEVPDGPWGFKDPRTTLTYPVWSEAFPRGPRLYIYRGHEEVLRYYNRRPGLSHRVLRVLRVRRAAHSWVYFNEKLLENLRSDQSAGRPYALVRYEELMEDKALIERLEKAVGVPLFDARNWDLRRGKVAGSEQNLVYRLALSGYEKRIAKLYQELGELRLV